MAGSLSDISKATGLGITTVSEILRDTPGYREETRQRVLEAARKLNYRPNLMARALKTGRSMTIGVVVGSLHTPISTLKLADIETQAQRAGYTTFVALGGADAPRQTLNAIDHLLDRQVDGLILMRTAEPSRQIMQRLRRSRTPVVFVDRAPADPACWKLTFNRAPAVQQAVTHLAALGHRHGVFLCTPSDWHDPSSKAQLWKDLGQQAGLLVETNEDYLMSPSKYYESQAYDLIHQRGQEGRLPGLMLMNNDACALAAIAAMQDLGLRVPQDVSVVGFDNTAEAAYSRPALTTIHQPREEVGILAFSMLLRAMEGHDQPESRTIDFQFIQRQSTAPPGSTPGSTPGKHP